MTGGCGGGGGGNSLSSPEKNIDTEPEPAPTPAPDPEPEPEPEPMDISQSEVDYALSLIVIGYSNGDNPDYVTHNLTLPVNLDETEDVAFTWTSSNPGVISTNGTVNRQANDTKVTLTVRAEKDTAFAEKSYGLNVIRMRSRIPEQARQEIQVNGVNEIRLMNVSNDELNISYSENRDRVTDIEGKYADFPIRTADDAVDAVQSLHGILGIEDPYEELEANVITSKIVPSSKLSDSDLSFTYTQDQAELTAKTYYVGSYDVRQDMTERLYSRCMNMRTIQFRRIWSISMGSMMRTKKLTRIFS